MATVALCHPEPQEIRDGDDTSVAKDLLSRTVMGLMLARIKLVQNFNL